MFDISTTPGTCPKCGSECNFVQWGKVQLIECDPCADAEKEARRAKERRAECLAAWTDITPPEFQTPIDPAIIAQNAPYLLPALQLDGTEGVGLIGTSYIGKTRIAYALLRKAAFAGLKPYAITGSKLRQAATMRATDPVEREKLKAAQYAQALLIDDIGKGSVTEAGDEAIYDLLNERRDRKRLTFWTANGNGKWIAARFHADRGPAIAFRLANLAGYTVKGTGRIFQPQDKTP